MSKPSVIKVQVYGGSSVTAVVTTYEEHGDYPVGEWPLTFHAFSDTMKARILENMIKSPARIGISFTDESPRMGEWHEPPIENAVFNR